MIVHRYEIIISLPLGALFGGVQSLPQTVSRTLKGLGIAETEPLATLRVRIPGILRLGSGAELTASDQAMLRANIESEYSKLGLAIEEFNYQGMDGTPEEKAEEKKVTADRKAAEERVAVAEKKAAADRAAADKAAADKVAADQRKAAAHH